MTKRSDRHSADSGAHTEGDLMFTFSVSEWHKCRADIVIPLSLDRPFRPRPPPDQAENNQQAAPERSPEQGEVTQTEGSEGPQTNGETAEGQKQRRQPRRRRQRNSESSTSKVSLGIFCRDKLHRGLNLDTASDEWELNITNNVFFLQNDTEKSASEPGTPPQTSKPSDLKSTSKSPKASPKTSPKTPKSSEVGANTATLDFAWSLVFVVLTQMSELSPPSLTRRRQLPQQSQHQQSDVGERTVTRPLAWGGDPTLKWSGLGQAGWETSGCRVAFLMLQVPHCLFFTEGNMMDTSRLLSEVFL